MEIEGYNMPDDLYYDENHFWVKDEGDLIVMGMDDFGQKMAGEIVYIKLPDDGKMLKKGKRFSAMESGKWLGKVHAPVNGQLITVNEALETQPDLINKACYGDGWMFKIKPDDNGDLEDLIQGREAIEKWVLADVEKYAKE
jgi:glycine cleavage system H protein